MNEQTRHKLRGIRPEEIERADVRHIGPALASNSRRECVTEFRRSSFTVEECRRFYAEEIRVVAAVSSRALINAFASVPRERFMGPPPWRFSSGISLSAADYRSTSDIRDLYHDVYIALKSERFLNNGQPTIIARLLAALDLAPGKRVIHVGCGAGYYTAIIAEAVGPKGAVVALEVDPELAALSVANLRAYANLNVFNQDGATLVPSPVDAILINAGVTHPLPAWLESLKEAGVLVAPFLVGRSPASNDAIVLRIARRGQLFKAELVTILTIYPSPSLRDPAIQSLLNAGFESHALLRLRSLRLDMHDRMDTCIVHTPAFCLSAESVP